MKADVAIAADKEDLARRKHEDDYEMQRAELSAQGIRLGLETDAARQAANQQNQPAPIPGAE
jgi:hypothetical protein